MLAEVMGDTAVGMAGTASNMSQPLMLRADMLPFVFAVGVATVLSGMRAATRPTQGAHITRPALVIGEVITDIRTTGIPGSAITVWAIAIHTMAITVTAPVGGTIRITHIILT